MKRKAHCPYEHSYINYIQFKVLTALLVRDLSPYIVQAESLHGLIVFASVLLVVGYRVNLLVT